MASSLILVNLLGAAALLLWGLRMVSTGINRAFGADLRQWIGSATRNRVLALLIGLAVTIALQSSTATCLMAASFVGRGLLGGVMAQALMLGANIGTSLVTKLLTFDVGPLSAALILAGVVVFRSGEGGRRRAIGRTVLGLGVMLLSLRLLDAGATPLADAPEMHRLLADLSGATVLGFVFAAGLTVLAHSSVAVILLLVPLAGSGGIGGPLALAMVLGANFGSAIPPVLETSGQPAAARRLAVGNAALRLLGCAACLPVLGEIGTLLPWLEAGTAAQLVDFHVAFNLVLAVFFLPLIDVVVAVMMRVLPDEMMPDDPLRAHYLDASATEIPSVAIGCATREALRLGDVVEGMLRRSLDLLRNGDIKLAAEIGKMDDVVDAVHQAVKLYLARLPQSDLDEADSQRLAEIMTLVINLEHIGDIIDRNIKELAEKKIKHKLAFSDEGLGEITKFYDQTLENLRIAMAIVVSGDVKLARQLIAEKVGVRNMERQATDAHLARLRVGRRESIETSTLHLDILRDLKRINAHIASVAYPILEKAGELRVSRLRQPPSTQTDPSGAPERGLPSGHGPRIRRMPV